MMMKKRLMQVDLLRKVNKWEEEEAVEGGNGKREERLERG
jgi:hypothetical protein